MDMNRFTQKAQEALADAQRLAGDMNHGQIEPEHLLLALVTQVDGVVPQVVSKLGVSPQTLQRQLEVELERRPKVYGGATQVGIGSALQNVLRRAEDQAKTMRDDFVWISRLQLRGLNMSK